MTQFGAPKLVFTHRGRRGGVGAAAGSSGIRSGQDDLVTVGDVAWRRRRPTPGGWRWPPTRTGRPLPAAAARRGRASRCRGRRVPASKRLL